ncbi:MAG: tandem-95 repeat protein, partial [Desulfobulbaceae bacterium]|nr:tandem-95 repeat protein [Desulfobulbaceae bacterium]
IDVGNPGIIDGVVQTTVTGLADGTTYYFAATAYDADGFESDYSQEVVWTSPVEDPITPPPPPIEEPLPPVANDMSVYIYEDNTVTGVFDGQSQDGLPLSYHLVTTGSIGTASITDSIAGAFSYIPNAHINGTDSFTYKVSDANGESSVATVHITINAVNDMPSAESASFSTNEDITLSGTLSGTDIEYDQLTYSIVSYTSLGSVVLINQGTGTFTYTPNSDLNGSDSFTYVVNDGLVNSNVATIDILIKPVNDVPIAFNGTLEVQGSEVANGVLQGADVDSSQLSFSIVSNGFLGSASIVDPETGTYTYTPNEGAYGDDTFQFIMSDKSSKSNLASVTVHIERAEAPFAMEIGELTVDGTWSYVSFTETFQ